MATRDIRPHGSELFEAGALPNARHADLPQGIEPEVAIPADRVPDGADWLFETKLDGHRLVARLDASSVLLVDRYRQEWQLPALARAVRGLGVDSALLDGELVALQSDGTTSFRRLQDAVSRGVTSQLVYEVFDLLYLNGYDLTEVALATRKHALKVLLTAGGALPNRGPIRYVHHFDGHGPELLEEICRLGLPGLVCKLRTARYRGGPSDDWIEVRCAQAAGRGLSHPEQDRSFAGPATAPPRLLPTVRLRDRRPRNPTRGRRVEPDLDP